MTAALQDYFFKTGDDGDLAERTLAVLRHFGKGRRDRFYTQVALRAETSSGGAISKRDWWRIFDRLQDFGLINLVVTPTAAYWVWTGDRLLQSAPNRFLCVASVVACDWFERLEITEIQRQTGFSLAVGLGVKFELSFLLLEAELKDSNAGPSVPTAVIGPLIGFLPSVREVFDRSARAFQILSPEEGFETRTLEDKSWQPARSLEQPSLLRRLRSDRTGYQYFSQDGNGHCYQIPAGDWLLLIHWYIVGAGWEFLYDRASQELAIPAHVFYGMPAQVRRALIQKKMKWPELRTIKKVACFIFDGVSAAEVRQLNTLYRPAIVIDYV